MKSMGQDSRKVRQVYDSLAAEYAAAFEGEHDKKPMDRELLARFATELGGRGPVWDLGCGPGQTAAFLKGLGMEISGLDISENLLARARALHPDIRFRQGDLLNLPFEDSSLAGIVSFYAIVHFGPEQVRAAFREMHRTLAPGGLLLFAFHAGDETLRIREFLGKEVDIDFSLFPPGFIERCLEERGFENIEPIERPPYPEIEYQSRRAYVFAEKKNA